MIRFLQLSISVFLLFILYAPLARIFFASVNVDRTGNTWGGFTLQWFRALYEDSAAKSALANSLVLAFVSAFISLVLGVMLAMAWSAMKRSQATKVFHLVFAALTIPDIVLAAALLLFFGMMREKMGLFELGLPTMIMAHATFQLPLVALVIRSRLAAMDPTILDAARDLGANQQQLFYRIQLPFLRPALVVAFLLCFTSSIDDFIISFFTSGPGSTTLPIFTYSSVKRGITPEVNALSALVILAAGLTVVFIACWKQGRRTLIHIAS